MSTYNFKAIVGVSRPTPNHAFLASLNGDTSYKAAATHWLAIVLASHVTDLGSIVHMPKSPRSRDQKSYTTMAQLVQRPT